MEKCLQVIVESAVPDTRVGVAIPCKSGCTAQHPDEPEIPPGSPPEEPAPNEPPGMPPGQPEEIPGTQPPEAPPGTPVEVPPGSPPELRARFVSRQTKLACHYFKQFKPGAQREHGSVNNPHLRLARQFTQAVQQFVGRVHAPLLAEGNMRPRGCALVLDTDRATALAER